MSNEEDEPEGARVRRASGARHPVSDPVRFSAGDREIDGWALNISRGGLRAIIDETVDVGGTFEVGIGDEAARPARVVWVREERGGAIVGVAFTDVEEGAAPPDEPPPAPGD